MTETTNERSILVRWLAACVCVCVCVFIITWVDRALPNFRHFDDVGLTLRLDP